MNANPSTISDDAPDGPGLNIGASAAKTIGYIPEFDGFRGVAAVMVIAVHLYMVVIPEEGELPSEITGTFLWIDMFFVLSAFLITSLLLKEQDRTGRVAFGAFWMRRALRLLPALYVLLGVHYLYARYVGLDMEIERESIFFTSIYGLNFRMDTLLTSRVSEGLTQLWSLSVEEQFYVAWPLVVAFLIPLRRKLNVVVPVMIGLAVIIGVRRTLLYNAADGANWFRLYTHTDTRADALVIGALLSYLWVHGRLDIPFVRRYIPGLAWVALAFVTWAMFEVKVTDPFAYRGGFTLFALSFAVMLLACVETNWPVRRLLRVGWIRGLGRVAYGLYLWHMLAMLSVSRAGATWSPWLRVVAALALTAISTAASWHLVEKPALRLKTRWDRRLHSPAATPENLPSPADAESPDSAPVAD